MTTTPKLKNGPVEVYALLGAQATSNRHSLNSEAIVCLETVLRAATSNTQDHLPQLRALRAKLGNTQFAPADIDKFKRQGRA